VGPMNYPNLVLNFHDYCPYRDPVTGDPTNLTACDPLVMATIARRAQQRNALGSSAQPAGPGLFMSEFGATERVGMLDQLVSDANQYLIGWTYWAWKDYDDPTGSTHEGLVGPAGQLEPTAGALAQTYPQAVAGTPVSVTDGPDGAFSLTYLPAGSISAPTVIFVPVALHYPSGYCATATGASVASAPEATYLDVVNHRGAHMVTVDVRSGSCPS
jgi:endoglycosylceramidase